MSRPAAVVFDCDGVLVDSEPHSVAAWLEVLHRHGHPATSADVAACTGLGFPPTHAALSALAPLPSPEAVWSELLEALSRSFATGLTVFADAVGALDACDAAGVPVAVVSASPRERLDLTLRGAGLQARFPVSVAGDEVSRGKPAPDGYLVAAARLGADPRACLAVEDTSLGVESALAAGMRVLAVVREEHTRTSLIATGARVVEQIEPSHMGL